MIQAVNLAKKETRRKKRVKLALNRKYKWKKEKMTGKIKNVS